MMKTLRSGNHNYGRRAYQLVKVIVKNLISKNYWTAKAYHTHCLACSDRQYKQPPLLVYQMGKVGSMTVVKSLKMARIDRPIHHVHFLTSEAINEHEKRYRRCVPPSKVGIEQIWHYKYLCKLIDRGLNGKKWKVVTMVRDPIARNISTFFQHIKLEILYEDRLKVKSTEHDFNLFIAKDNIGKLISTFFDKFPHDIPLIYFDRFLKPVFHIDVYASDFPKQKGYKIYEGKTADVLLMRLEDLNVCAGRAFCEFLNVKNLKILKENVGEQKEYADLYQRFKASIRFPDSYLTEMYTSRFAQHFYNEEELEKFWTKWSKRSSFA